MRIIERRNDPIKNSYTALLDLIIRLAHAAGNKAAVISAHLPYDAAHFADTADAIVVAYGARGMNEDPREKDGNVAQYGANIPAALYLMLSAGESVGKLPISIPKLDENGKFTDKLLYPNAVADPR